ncbi:Xaa-Pro dipeptidyl-peptidase [Actinoplanes sp. OR16]|uniref:Xaa-Pro dipeptidyl-peptidase n=1 Tax=Actinoplanes sp. OR16 TaxID=946334 RepID=UPI000F7001B9|nr:Xaa-Pro dipeptidyl-peptidase [Actinoplanes sp. OR16]BBH71649.1 Xaa-Pro dipeptidyl-peptidase [Actinoplanes sp. OR16]
MRYVLALVLVVASLAFSPPVSAAPPAGTQPIYDYASAIREQVWVEAPVDSDADGSPDRVAVRIIRPAISSKVPAIFQASPYYAGLNDVPNHDDIDRDGGLTVGSAAIADRAQNITFAGYLDNYFVPRGYAVVFADSLGTGGSTGCPTSGGRNETLGAKAVIDWMNGRARAFDAAGNPVAANWATGRTGMIGVSYNGTLPNAVAATGVRGLETIVPIAAISSWYDYYRANGGVVAPGGFQGEDTDVLAKAVLTRSNPEVCASVMADLERLQDRETGDYSAYWAERDYLRDVGKVRASVFLVHGLHDDNVRTLQAGQWWDALAARGVPRKIWLHQAAHTDPFNVRRQVWLTTLNKWFDQWLYKIDTGIMREPIADVETAPTVWQTSTRWPLPGVPTSLRLGDGTLGGGWSHARQSFVDDPSRTASDLVSSPGDDPNRLVYRTAPLPRSTRISGTPTVTVRASLAGESPYLTAMLVDYGTADRYAGLRTLTTQDCIGPGIEGDPGCFFQREYVTASTPFEIVSYGWLDVRNRLSQSHSVPVVPGREYTFHWDLQTTDHVFAAGHQLGLVLISTERDHTLRYPAGTVVNVRPSLSNLQIRLS